LQLAEVSPVLKSLICKALKKNRNIANQLLRDQWKKLILDPLRDPEASSLPKPLLIVIDALDECDGDAGGGIKGILRLFTGNKMLNTSRLRIFLTSRPEIPIRLGFHNPEILHRDLILNEISRDIVDNDISIYLDYKFGEIRDNASDEIPNDWPGKKCIDLLVSRAHGLFIYAATVCRFIAEHSEQYPVDGLLRLVLPDNSITGSSIQAPYDVITNDSPTKELDMMYTVILEESVRNVHDGKDKPQLVMIFRQVVGAIVILFNPLSTIAIARLLDMQITTVKKRLDHLHSVLEVRDEQSYLIRILHPSFQDFLLDNKRCNQQFWVDKEKAHHALAESCLRLMSSNLERDICDLRAPDALASRVDHRQLEQCLPAELRYACCYWVQHLRQSKAVLSDKDPVHEFLQVHLLHWLEALSLLGKTSDSVKMVTDLQPMVVSGIGDTCTINTNTNDPSGE
jgi:hypothetical protein